MLEKVDLTKRLKKKEYKKRMPPLQNRLHDLQKACWDAGIISDDGSAAKAGKRNIIRRKKKGKKAKEN